LQHQLAHRDVAFTGFSFNYPGSRETKKKKKKGKEKEAGWLN